MELERRNIERRDFSQTRRGYDPDEVNRHLRLIAEAVDELKINQARPPSIAGAAAARVEAIVAAAESSAQEIEEKARADADAARVEAERAAAERITETEDIVERLMSGAREMQNEVGDIVRRVGGLKGAIDALRTDLDAAVPDVASGNLELGTAEVAEPEVNLDRLDFGHDAAASQPPPPVPGAGQPGPPPAPHAAGGGGSSGEGARLIALNMALGGTPREETARYLRENFDLDNQDDLLDEVYARAGS